MQSVNTYKYITAATTTLFAGETKRIVLNSICFNKALTGAVTVRSGGAAGPIIATYAIGSTGTGLASTHGTEIEDLAITNASAEDITVLYRNI